METFITEILPRQNDSGTVMNIRVQFIMPEQNHRNNIVEATIFLDKTIDSLSQINRLAVDSAVELLKKIIDHHS